MKKNLDKTKPWYSEQIFPVSWPFVRLLTTLPPGGGGGGGTPIHYLYGYVPPNGVVTLKLLI